MQAGHTDTQKFGRRTSRKNSGDLSEDVRMIQDVTAL
jgi:hypothetical protein